MMLTAAFWAAVGITLLRLKGGVAIGASAGLLLGWTMGAVRVVRITAEPLIARLHLLPKLALFPLFLLLLGIGGASKVAVAAVTVFFPVLPNTLAGVEQIERTYYLTVTMEMLAAQQGLGAQRWLAWQMLRLQERYATLAVISLVGFMRQRLRNLLTRRPLPWQVPAKENE